MIFSDKKHDVKENRNTEIGSDSQFRFSTKESELITRLKKLQKDESNVAFAKRCGISESGYRHILKGQTPNLDTISKIARANGVRNSWLVGDSPMDTTHGDDVMTFESDPTPSARQTHKEYSHTIYIESFPDVRAAAGDGQVIGTPTDQISVSVAINAAEWRRYVGLNPVHIKMITAHGDSMFPTIKHGDNVLVDTETHRFIDDAVYAIVHDGYVRIKRIQLRLDGSIVVKSDNKHYNNGEPEIYKPGEYDNFNILGKVLPFKFGSFEL